MMRVYIAPCPKCGEGDPYIEYQLNSDHCSHGSARPAEHFDIRCIRCGYEWWRFLEGDPQNHTALGEVW